MAFQTVTNVTTANGIPGDLAYFGPEPRVQARIMYSAGQAQTMGFAFTESTSGDMLLGNTVIVGGTGKFAGILVQPKSASTFGTTAGGPLAATLNMPDYSTGQMCSFGDVYVALGAAAAIGDLVTYHTTTGALSTVPFKPSAFTASQSTTVLNVSAFTAGTAPIKVGSTIYLDTGTYVGTVQSLGTGTGGTGTYNLETNATVGSGTMHAAPVASASNIFVPNARVNHYPLTTSGVAVITLTN
jgi:hypothetical protein